MKKPYLSRPGDKVRIIKGQNAGREGRVVWLREGIVKVQYGNSCWHVTTCKVNNVEVVR